MEEGLSDRISEYDEDNDYLDNFGEEEIEEVERT